MLLRRTLPVLFILSSLLLFACAKSQSVAPPTNRDDGPTLKAAGTPVAQAATTSTGGKIGVAECDEYFAKVDACVATSKLPEIALAQYKAIIDQNRQAWQKLVTTPDGKAKLAEVCTKATEAARTSMKSLNCKF